MENLSRRAFLQKAGMGAAMAALSSVPAFGSNYYQNKKLNIALCGLGRYAEYLAEGLQSSQYCRLSGIITGTPSKAESWKKRYNIADGNIYNYETFDQIRNNKTLILSTWFFRTPCTKNTPSVLPMRASM